MYNISKMFTCREMGASEIIPVGICKHGCFCITLALTCPKGFGLKLVKLGLKIPLKTKAKQKQSQAKPS